MSLQSVWWRSVKDAPFYTLMVVGLPLGLALDCIGVSLARRVPGDPLDMRRVKHCVYCGVVTVALIGGLLAAGLVGGFVAARTVGE